jgi:GrpB-like predicted nucleotidyltransferase (UPF0157 family)
MIEKVELVNYNNAWPKLYNTEAEKIQNALGANCIKIHHIGSTSIPYLSAKPIIDILVVVNDLSLVDECNHKMQELGYNPEGEYGFFLKRYFIKKNKYHVHVMEDNNPEICRHIKFRDWLRKHAYDRQAYAELKQKLASQYRDDRTAYTFAKSEFVTNIEYKAGWNGIKVVKAFTVEEFNFIKEIKKKNHLADEPDCCLFTDANHMHLIVYKRNDIIGYSHIDLNIIDKPIVKFLIVLERERKSGIGSYFLKLIERWVKSRKLTTIYILVCEDFMPFYQNNGYTEAKLDHPPLSINEKKSHLLSKPVN